MFRFNGSPQDTKRKDSTMPIGNNIAVSGGAKGTNPNASELATPFSFAQKFNLLQMSPASYIYRGLSSYSNSGSNNSNSNSSAAGVNSTEQAASGATGRYYPYFASSIHEGVSEGAPYSSAIPGTFASGPGALLGSSLADGPAAGLPSNSSPNPLSSNHNSALQDRVSCITITTFPSRMFRGLRSALNLYDLTGNILRTPCNIMRETSNVASKVFNNI